MSEALSRSHHPPAGYYPPTDNPKAHVISFRLNADEFASVLPFIASFADHRMATAFRWLIEQPEVTQVMADKIRRGIEP